MKSEDYTELNNLLWQRIIFVGQQKIDFESIFNGLTEVDEDLKYGVYKSIIERLSEDENPTIVIYFIRNLMLQLGFYIEESDLMELVNLIIEKNQNEILAVQTLNEMIDNRDSWETICLAIEIIIQPDE
jgi:hypothetical protein